MRALAAALALVLAAPLAAQDQPAWRRVDAATGQIADVAGLEALARDFPDSSSVRVRLLLAQLAAGDIDAALESLAWLKARGYVFSEAAQGQIADRVGPDRAAAAKGLLLPKAEAVEASEVVATLPPDAGVIESVYVPEGSSGGYIATSVTQQTLFMATAQGGFAMDIPDGADDLSGVAETFDHREIWLASSNIDGSTDDEPGFSGLIGFIADQGGPVFVPAPAGVTLSDLAAGADGTIYASDPVGGGVYVKARGARELSPLVAPGTIRSPQGLAASADGTTLYVSDYRYGIAMIDPATRAVSRLVSDVPVVLDGVDGMWLHDGELIAVQNGTLPMKISAFALSGDGRRIVGYRVLEQAHPGWTEPLGGSIHSGALIYVATGQWDRYDKGQLREGMSALPTAIRRLPLER
jgi:hypothetical protein